MSTTSSPSARRASTSGESGSASSVGIARIRIQIPRYAPRSQESRARRAGRAGRAARVPCGDTVLTEVRVVTSGRRRPGRFARSFRPMNDGKTRARRTCEHRELRLAASDRVSSLDPRNARGVAEMVTALATNADGRDRTALAYESLEATGATRGSMRSTPTARRERPEDRAVRAALAVERMTSVVSASRATSRARGSAARRLAPSWVGENDERVSRSSRGSTSTSGDICSVATIRTTGSATLATNGSSTRARWRVECARDRAATWWTHPLPQVGKTCARRGRGPPRRTCCDCRAMRYIDLFAPDLPALEDPHAPAGQADSDGHKRAGHEE